MIQFDKCIIYKFVEIRHKHVKNINFLHRLFTNKIFVTDVLQARDTNTVIVDAILVINNITKKTNNPNIHV